MHTRQTLGLDGKFYGRTWTVDPKTNRLRELISKYHQLTESYDQQVCSGVSERTGCAMPTTHIEAGLIRQNAIQVRNLISNEALAEGFTPEEIKKAFSDYRPD